MGFLIRGTLDTGGRWFFFLIFTEHTSFLSSLRFVRTDLMKWISETPKGPPTHFPIPKEGKGKNYKKSLMFPLKDSTSLRMS